MVHFFLIHSLSVLLGVIQGFEARQFLTHFLLYPAGYGVPLIGVYFIWIVVVLMMYPICHAMAKTKSRRRDWWLSYL